MKYTLVLILLAFGQASGQVAKTSNYVFIYDVAADKLKLSDVNSNATPDDGWRPFRSLRVPTIPNNAFISMRIINFNPYQFKYEVNGEV